MDSRDSVAVDDVLVIRQMDLGWLCQIDGRRTFIGKLQVAPGADVPPPGQRGTVTLTMSAAWDLDLAPLARQA